MTRTIALLACVLALWPAQQAVAQQTREQNLQTCLSGKYPSLCRYDILSDEQRVQVRAAELRENLRVCLTGRYPTLCNHADLTPPQALAVKEAERSENLKVCLTGKYPALCNHELLSAEERVRVRSAEVAENLQTCLDGRWASLCDRSLLSPQQRAAVGEAEARAAAASKTAKPSPPAVSSTAACYESSIMNPTPFLGNDGEIFKLADGTLWEVKYEYEYMYEYYPSVIICPSRETLLIGRKTLNVKALLSGEQPGGNTTMSPAMPNTVDVIESRIDGEFSGWEGETIFKLQNGQIWQQTSYAYKYKYAYSPKVLIYKSGSGYRMRVDSVEGEIAVTRLR